MNARRPILILTLALLLFPLWLRAEGYTYDDGFEPKPPAPFPAEFKDYQILPGSISPDGACGLIYPKRSVVLDLDKPGLYLAQLKPFLILKEIPLTHDLESGAHGSYDVDWAKDSSLFLVTEGSKWGPDSVFLVTMNHGKVGSITNLITEIRKKLQSAYNKVKAKVERYNDYYDYIFDSDNVEGWNIVNHNRQIDIWCICTTNPKPPRAGAWEADFAGLWDI